MWDDLHGEGVFVLVLGMMQDGGLPHAGCRCKRCAAAFAAPEKGEWAACVGVVERRGRETAVWLIDATPDIRYQLNLLAPLLGPHPTRPNRLRQPNGIFLTHAHMGHIGGLPHMGPEAMAVSGLPVYAAKGLVDLLRENRLWRPLVNCLALRELAAGEVVMLSEWTRITAVSVPHRDEWGTGTFAFRVDGPNKSLLYLPDIDDWAQWPQAQSILWEVDYALVDASFYSRAELGGREPVAHPLVTDTLHRFTQMPGQLVLTHLNHTNPVLDRGSAERAVVEALGVRVAETGMWWQL